MMLVYRDSGFNVHLFNEQKLHFFEELQKFLKHQTFLMSALGRVLFA